MFFDLLKPVIKILKSLLLEQVKYQNNAFSPLVVCICDSAVALLASSVPNLELDFTSLQLEGSESEVNSDSGGIVLNKVIIRKPYQDTRLADTTVAQEHNLK